MLNIITNPSEDDFRGVNYSRIIYFGAGSLLKRSLCGVCTNSKVSYIVDNNPYLIEEDFNFLEYNLPIKSLNFLKKDITSSDLLIITIFDCEKLIKQLDEIIELDGVKTILYGLECSKEKENYTLKNEWYFKAQQIPKKIHYCWFGYNDFNDTHKKCIESWKKYCPDYEIIRWDESNYDYTKNNFVKQAYENKKWAFVSDYARLDIIYNNGGIYLDTDVELVSSLDQLLHHKAYMGREFNNLVNTGLGFGAIKNHLLIKKLLDSYNDIDFVKSINDICSIACPFIQTNALVKLGYNYFDQDFQIIQDTIIYPEKYFQPMEINNYFKDEYYNSAIFSIHHYGKSYDWNDRNTNTTNFMFNRLLSNYKVLKYLYQRDTSNSLKIEFNK